MPRELIRRDENGNKIIPASKQNVLSEVTNDLILRPKPKSVYNVQVVKSIGDLTSIIRERRKELGLTQTDISMAIGISREYYSDLETGKSVIGVDQLLKICAKLDLTISIT